MKLSGLFFPLPHVAHAVEPSQCISVGMVQCWTAGATLLVCVSISPACDHLAVIFSFVEPTGNPRHSFAYFPTNWGPDFGYTLTGRLTDNLKSSTGLFLNSS